MLKTMIANNTKITIATPTTPAIIDTRNCSIPPRYPTLPGLSSCLRVTK